MIRTASLFRAASLLALLLVAGGAGSAQPVPPPNLGYFQQQLAPYGVWMNIPGYGVCWRPNVTDSWRPYCDDGQWIDTDYGWYWQSDDPWGDIVFHYGRWFRYPDYGWVWVPDYVWGPAWVCWRYADSDGDCGWAPLPPGAVFVDGVGIEYNGVVVDDVDFGLGYDAFIFIGCDHFWDGNYGRFALAGGPASLAFRHSVVRNGYRIDGGRLFVGGPDRNRIAAITHRPDRPVAATQVRQREERDHANARAEQVRRAPPAPVRQERPPVDNGRQVEPKPGPERENRVEQKPEARPQPRPEVQNERHEAEPQRPGGPAPENNVRVLQPSGGPAFRPPSPGERGPEQRAAPQANRPAAEPRPPASNQPQSRGDNGGQKPPQ